MRPTAAMRLTDVTTVPLVEKNSSTILRVAASIIPAATSLAVTSTMVVRSHSYSGSPARPVARVHLGELQLKGASEQHLRELAPEVAVHDPAATQPDWANRSSLDQPATWLGACV